MVGVTLYAALDFRSASVDLGGLTLVREIQTGF